MKRFPKLAACGIWMASTLALFVLGLVIISLVGDATNSSLLGICGPTASGPYADLLGFMLLGTLIISPVLGGYIAWRFYLRFTRGNAKREAPATTAPGKGKDESNRIVDRSTASQWKV